MAWHGHYARYLWFLCLGLIVCYLLGCHTFPYPGSSLFMKHTNEADGKSQSLPTQENWYLPHPSWRQRTGSRKDNSTPNFLSSPFLRQKSVKTENNSHRKQHTDVLQNRTKLILFYNMPRWFLKKGSMDFSDCLAQGCSLTTNRSLLSQADVVIFHIFFFRDKQPPKHRPRGQIWVAFGLEPPYALGSNMLTREWSRAFNWTMTYRVDSDLFLPYGKLAYRGAQKDKNYTHLALTKHKSAAWFVSNCHAPSQRLAYVREFQKHYPVDIFGRCGSLQCPRSSSSQCMSLLNSTYRFYLSFESSFCRDYVTEKFFKLFQPDFHVIPIVRGGSQYRKFFPSGTFVDASEFRSSEALAKYLKKLESDTERYAAMLREKDKYYVEWGRKEGMCELCEKVHWDSTPRMYPSLAAWLTNRVCWSPQRHSYGSPLHGDE
ncbi:hypothetical protein ACOMHN_063972 [Nucella lapillus]